MDLRRWPKFKYLPTKKKVNYKTLPRGSALVRIFDIAKSRINGYKAFDYNPTLVEDRRDVRGRYSACKTKFHPDAYSYLYVGEQLTDERVVLLECIDIISLRRDERDCRRRVPRKLLKNLAFAYVRCSRDLNLLNISTRPLADAFRAPWDVLQGRDHSLTRQWARYFRSICPEIDGLYYCPIPYGTSADGGNVILFAKHGENGDHLDEEVNIVPFSSLDGINKLKQLEQHTNMRFG